MDEEAEPFHSHFNVIITPHYRTITLTWHPWRN